MDISKAKEALKLLITSSEKQIITPFMIGKPGIGKSEVMRQIQSEMGYDVLLDIRMSQHDNTDLKGVPKEVDGSLTWLTPEFMPVVGSKYEGKKVILFFDEMNRATHDVLQSIFEIVLDRKIGGKPLIDSCFVVAAGNYGYEDNTNVTEMDAALKNRFVFLDIDDVLLPQWIEHESVRGGNRIVQKFLEANPSRLYDASDKRLITPRSWSKFSDLLTNNKGKEVEVITLLGPGIIYDTVPTFLDFFHTMDQITAEDVIKRFSKVEKKLKELEQADIYALLKEVVFATKETTIKFTKKEYGNLEKFIENYLTDDFQVIFLQELAKENETFLKAWAEHYPELTIDYKDGPGRMNYAKKVWDSLH